MPPYIVFLYTDGDDMSFQSPLNDGHGASVHCFLYTDGDDMSSQSPLNDGHGASAHYVFIYARVPVVKWEST